MAVMRFKSVNDYVVKLQKIKDPTPAIEAALYNGADVLANEIRRNIEKLPEKHEVASGHYVGVSDVERKGLLDSFGITPISDRNGYHDLKMGFDGYNEHKTKKYPKGHPNQMIARSVESGTSWLQKTPFVAPAIRIKRKEVEKIMADTVDKEIEKKMK